MPQIKGEFDVARTSASPVDLAGASSMRIRFDKRFHGALDATSVVEMMSIGTPVDGSGAYVAIEHVTGTIDGRLGSFSFTHVGVMERGAPSLLLRVVPDSGTEALIGLRGQLAIDIAGGKHYYTFDYELA